MKFLLLHKNLLLQILDKSWKDHLLSLDHLRQGISLRAYGQKDPLNEYKQEAFLMFEEMMQGIRFNVSNILSFIEIKTDVDPNKDITKTQILRVKIKRYQEIQYVLFATQEKNINIVVVSFNKNQFSKNFFPISKYFFLYVERSHQMSYSQTLEKILKDIP